MLTRQEIYSWTKEDIELLCNVMMESALLHDLDDGPVDAQDMFCALRDTSKGLSFLRWMMEECESNKFAAALQEVRE
jgi:hypothetical protein